MDVSVFHRDAWVVDAHTHGLGMLPAVPRAAYRVVNRTTMPADVDLGAFRRASVNAAIVKAVGDAPVTRWYRGGAFNAVRRQLASLRAQLAANGGAVTATKADLDANRMTGTVAGILGVEGADAVGDDLDRFDELAADGVKVVGLIHLGHNQFGTTSMPWLQYVGAFPSRRQTSTGLTPLGRAAVARLDALGVVIDVAHADRSTTLDVVDETTRPVISSHAGAAAAGDGTFARFLDDDELRAVASTGGVVGLWPYSHRGRGVATVAGLVDHARYIADLVGPEHLCIGTDMNGVPGLMRGYRGETDLPIITGALLDAGFDAAETHGILGENIGRVLHASLA